MPTPLSNHRPNILHGLDFMAKFYGLKKIWSKMLKLKKIKVGPNLHEHPPLSFIKMCPLFMNFFFEIFRKFNRSSSILAGKKFPCGTCVYPKWPSTVFDLGWWSSTVPIKELVVRNWRDIRESSTAFKDKRGTFWVLTTPRELFTYQYCTWKFHKTSKKFPPKKYRRNELLFGETKWRSSEKWALMKIF